MNKKILVKRLAVGGGVAGIAAPGWIYSAQKEEEYQIQLQTAAEREKELTVELADAVNKGSIAEMRADYYQSYSYELEMENDKLRKDIEDLKDLIDVLAKTKPATQKDVADRDELLEQAGQKIRSMKKEIAALRKQVEELEEEKESIIDDLEESSEYIVELRDKVDLLKKTGIKCVDAKKIVVITRVS